MKPQIDIVIEEGDSPELERIEKIAETIWEEERVQGEYEISILFCGDDRMRELNRQYRGCDSVTDVLSFSSKAFDLALGGQGEKWICDIIIDTKYIQSQKGSNGYTQEIEEVLIHSFLHILGYDHMKTKDKEKMETKENYYKQLLQGVS